MSYDFYNAWKSIAKTPNRAFEDITQAMIDKNFNISTSIKDVQQETPVGSNVWVDLKARLTHKINVDTGVRLSDDWRNIIFKDAEHDVALGTKFKIENDFWLVLNTEVYKMPTSSALIRKCNWTLKWYNKKGHLIQEPCIVEYVKMISSAMGVLEGKQMREGTYDRFVYLQANEETRDIDRDQRFFIDDIVFRVTKRDSIAHYGLIELSLDEHQVNEDIDDTENKITDKVIRPPEDNSDTGTTEVIFGGDKISMGATSLYTIYKKIDGEKQPDTYTFSIVGTGATIINSTGNTVTLQSGNIAGAIFSLKATNDDSAVVISKTIQVSGMW